MNDSMIYDLARQRHHDVIDEVRRSRSISFRAYQGSWTRVTTGARNRLAVVAHVLTNRAWTPTADR
jgi:hypothetical protein